MKLESLLVAEPEVNQEGGRAKAMPEHKQPSSVSESSRQGGEARAEQWNWVEAAVWAELLGKRGERRQIMAFFRE
jgi:hypothetical protein